MRASYSIGYRFVAVLMALLMLPLPALTQGSSSSQPAGQITALIPQATRNGSVAGNKDEVMWNDLLRTEGGGRARVQLRDGSILSLGSNSELKIVQHDPASQQTQLELNYGRVRSRVVQITKPGGKFEVKTPVSVAGVVGTDFITIHENGHTIYILFSGKLVIMSLAGATLATLGPGQMVDIGPNGEVNGPSQTPQSVQEDAINQTNPGNGVVGERAANGSLLKTFLIFLGVAAAGAIIYSTTGSPNVTATPTPTPTFCSNCSAVGRSRH